MARKAPKHILQAHRLISGRVKITRKAHGKAEYKHLSALRDLYKDPNIVGLGIADKMTDGKRTGEPTLRFYVRKKRSKKRLGSDKLIPPVIMLGDRAILTDVYEMSSPFRALANVQDSPVESGFSVGTSSDVRAGTVGAIVSFGTTRYILSNAHVLDGKPDQTEVVYPAMEDNNNRSNVVGLLKHIVVFESSGNRADAALAEINTGVVFDPAIPGAVTPYTVGTAAMDMKVVGTGRTSGTIRGIIRDLDFDGNVRVAGETIGFEDQIVCEGLAADGDSGAVIVEQGTDRILGLLFAASNDKFMFTPIATVREELAVNFKFVGPN